MRNLKNDFDNKNIDYDKLLNYGFKLNKDIYLYEKYIDENFKIIVEISNDKQISKIVDIKINEEYNLVDVKSAKGEFIGKIKEQYENLLDDIINKCTTPNIFKSKQSKQIIKYIKEKYNDDLEFLWDKFPNNAIWRNKKNNKWYALLLTIKENKIGLSSDKLIEIIDIRYPKEEISNIIDNKIIFKGYHMNKNSWITIKLDGNLDIKYIFKLIDDSYNISLNK